MDGDWKVPEGMDAECVDLCSTINKIEGVRTQESCCGHGENPFRIWVDTNELDRHFALLLWALDKCHTGVPSWRCTAYTDCLGDDVSLLIESQSKGEEAYKEAAVITGLLETELADGDYDSGTFFMTTCDMESRRQTGASRRADH